jgi:hypothetical protein
MITKEIQNKMLEKASSVLMLFSPVVLVFLFAFSQHKYTQKVTHK